MNYVSTRDNSKKRTAAQAIVKGISPEGGLFVPESLPTLTQGGLERLAKLDYCTRAREILALFLEDYSQEELEGCVTAAYAQGNFENDVPAPLAKLGEDRYLLELWHGPTCAFKDMALQLLPKLLPLAARKSGCDKEIVILTATSGDTGKAALEGFRDVPGTRIAVFYPQEGVSRMQKRQMTTQQGENVAVLGIRGNFDDAQNGVKAIFGNRELEQALAREGFVLSSANSINWGRLAPQIVYYISAYCQLLADAQVQPGERVNFCVPTGNFGNILAGYYAKAMGLPVGMLLCASNRNNVLSDFIATGRYDRNRKFYTTTSPSMDILISSNLERLVYLLTGASPQETREKMESLRNTGVYELTPGELEALQKEFWGGYCSDAEAAGTIGETFREYSYLCDPHTAVAVNVCSQYRAKTGDTAKTVILSTASPYKFADAVLDALEVRDRPEDDFARLELLEQLTKTPIPGPLLALREAVCRFDRVCEPQEMTRELLELLKK